MSGLESLGSLRGEALPEYLGCCYISLYHHHHQGDVEMSLQNLPRHLYLPHLGKDPGELGRTVSGCGQSGWTQHPTSALQKTRQSFTQVCTLAAAARV